MPSDSHSSKSCPSHWSFSSSTVHAIMQWLNNGQTMKSEAETSKFVHHVILSPLSILPTLPVSMHIVKINDLTRHSHKSLYEVNSLSHQWTSLCPWGKVILKVEPSRFQVFCIENSSQLSERLLKACLPTYTIILPSNFSKSHQYLGRMNTSMAKSLPLTHFSKKLREFNDMARFLLMTLDANKRKSLQP
jgi:hypothetical protein